MAMVAQPPPPIRTSGHDKRLSTRQSKHKVVLESVTQEKKKLRSVLSFKAEPPKGYTFIPAGNPELTNAMKEFARRGNYEIYAVSTTPHQRAHDLSQQVHRIGFHFPSVVVAQVCAHYGIVLTSAGTVLAEDESHSLHRRSKRLKENAATHERKDQITINTEARDTIRDLFPNIPDNDLNQIIKTAFQKGQGKVGTASELSLIRRAQLAVVAHIRHIYTDYDKLLRQTHYRDARNLVEKPTLRKLVQWRGDDEDGKEVLEDIFREVVVISDDEDSGEEEDQSLEQIRDVSVEIVSTNTKDDHFKPDPPFVHNPVIRRRPGSPYSGNSKQPPNDEYIAAPSRKGRPKDKDKFSRRGFSRYQAWIEAQEEYRANPTDALVVNERVLAVAPPEMSSKANTGLGGSGHQPMPTPSSSREPHHYQDISTPHHNDPPNTFRARDGTLYERVVNYSPRVSHQSLDRPLVYESPSSAAADKVRRTALANSMYLAGRSRELDSPRETVLPSIEGSQLVAASSEARFVSSNHPSLLLSDERRAMTTYKDLEPHFDDLEYLDLTGETQQPRKRRRIENIGREIPHIARSGIVAPDLHSERREPEYTSLLPPADQYWQPSNSHGLFSSQHPHFRDHSKVSSVRPTYCDIQESSSSAAISHADDGPAHRQPAGELSGLDHFRSPEVSFPRISSRINGSIPSRLRSALRRSATPVDRGIQQYRAFRARERHDRALRSPPGRGRPPSHKNSDFTGAMMESRNGQLRHLDGAESSRALSYHSPPPRGILDPFATADPAPLPRVPDYRLTHEREVERARTAQRRSASPADNLGDRVSYISTLSPTQIQRQHGRMSDYVPVGRTPLAEHSERLDPWSVRPRQR